VSLSSTLAVLKIRVLAARGGPWSRARGADTRQADSERRPIAAGGGAAHDAPTTLRIPSLDGMRALSIGLVLLAHVRGTRYSPELTWIETFGDIGNLGVRIFFVISGFLITLLLYREFDRTGRISLVGFLRRRAFRIVPAFAAYVGALMVATAVGIFVVDSGDFVSAMTFTTNFEASRSWYVGHLWSLSVEEQFYVCWPVLLVVVGRPRMIWVAIAALGIGPLSRVGLYVFFPEYRWAVGETLPTVVDALACGGLLAALHERLAASHLYLRWLRSRAVAATPLAVIALNAGAAHIAFSYTLGQTLLNGLIALMLHRVMLFPNSLVGRILNAGPVAAVGALSYSLYLWQQPFLNRTSTLFIAAFPLNIVFAVGAALLSYHVVERPALKMGRRLARNSVLTSKTTKTRRSALACDRVPGWLA
jgi:peptidoglycan/LPS O-acetylase OafA/YrhL